MQQVWAEAVGGPAWVSAVDPHPLTKATAEDPVLLAEWIKASVSLRLRRHPKLVPGTTTTIQKPLSDFMGFLCFSFTANQADIDAGELITNVPVPADPCPYAQLFLLIHGSE